MMDISLLMTIANTAGVATVLGFLLYLFCKGEIISRKFYEECTDLLIKKSAKRIADEILRMLKKELNI